MNKYSSPLLTDVKLNDSLLSVYSSNCTESTIPAVIRKIVETGRIQAFDLNWQEGMPNKPHIFWDSDTAKVMEGIAYTLAVSPNEELEKLYDEWVDRICAAQQPDGYLNSYFTGIDPEGRFKCLGGNHELYCAGHLIEAAVAGYVYLGKTKFLDALCRYADYLADTFGYAEEGKRGGWPGHEEIELALAKLYKITGKEEYHKLLQYFINDRGGDGENFEELKTNPFDRDQIQAHAPVREHSDARGHAVRQMYLLCGMADLAALDDDRELLAACERVYENIVNKRMYITGGVGSCFFKEKFGVDYDLSNGALMYSESCANMAMVLFAWRMYNITGESSYMDTAEQALFNSALSGISLQGDTFFYPNYLEMDENIYFHGRVKPYRQEWFKCSCCPTSFARFLPQMSTFIYSLDEAENAIVLNIPVANSAVLTLNGQKISLQVAGNYPFAGNIKITVNSDAAFALQLRKPAWCSSCTVKVNGEKSDDLRLVRQWRAGDVVELTLEMLPQFIYSNLRVTTNAGRVAIMLGPVVYALEEVDQSCPVRELMLRTDRPLNLVPAPAGLPDGVAAITGEAVREKNVDGSLYSTTAPVCEPAHFLAVPYCLWQNRGVTNMAVWMRKYSASGTIKE